jgi:RNA polymerase-binding transcription factor DksA
MAKKPAPKKAVKPAKKAAKPAPKKVAKPAAKKTAKPAPKKAVKAAKAKPAPKKAVAKAPAKKKATVKAVAKKTAKAAPKKASKAVVKPSSAKAAAGKKAAKKVPRPVKKAVVAPASAKAAAGKSKKVAKVAPKKVVKPVVKKAAPKAPAKAEVKKAAPKAPVKPAPKPVPAKAETKPAPKPVVVPAPKAEKPAPAPKPVKKESKKSEKDGLRSAAASKPLVTQILVPNRPMSAPTVKKHVSTLESADKLRYSDDELVEFRDLINRKLDEARKDYDLLKQTLANTDNNGTDDTSPSFKMIEDGSETLSREETAQLAARQEKFIKHLEDALLRIRNKTYGICRVTGRLISKERLRLVPHATLSIEAKQQMNG